MELIGFKLQDQIAILTNDGYYFDLHSNFDFVNLEYDVINKSVIFSWKKSIGNWAKEEKIGNIQMKFQDVCFFVVHQKNLYKKTDNDQNLSFIGYLHPEDLDINDGSLLTNGENKSFHIILGFESGMSVRIFANEVRLSYAKQEL